MKAHNKAKQSGAKIADPGRDARAARTMTEAVEGAPGQLEKTSIIDKELKDLVWWAISSGPQEALFRAVIQAL